MTLSIEEIPNRRKYKPRVFKQKPRKPSKNALKRKKGYKVIGDELVRVWKLSRADKHFSERIRLRDWSCRFPNCGKTTQLTCSHYFPRAVKATRFDPENCITLCTTHHFWDKMLAWEFQKQRLDEQGWDGRYTLYMKEWLGEERFRALVERSKVFIGQKDAIWSYQSSVLNSRN